MSQDAERTALMQWIERFKKQQAAMRELERENEGLRAENAALRATIESLGEG